MYEAFAYLYDVFMDNIPYEEWCEYLRSILVEEGVKEGLLCELGCGTGNMTELLMEAGYDMIGIDNSEDMLDVAREKLYELEFEGEPPILYLNQDMRSFELYGTVRAIVSVCDSLNYLTDSKDVLKVLKLAANYLDPGGVFIFDMKTDYFYRTRMGDNTFTDVREDCAMIWENEYDEANRINSYNLTLFDRDEDGRYVRSEEFHTQRAYSIEEMRALIEEAGLEFVASYNAFTREAATETSERVYYVVREKHHEGKLYI
ncbi:MAG: class I SAM-dependent methyltransferase [Lachnospiraceae bacterium]|nr:class I SAM-dependent methyltransferase [Lachnospiraceae bacterium]